MKIILDISSDKTGTINIIPEILVQGQQGEALTSLCHDIIGEIQKIDFITLIQPYMFMPIVHPTEE